MGLERLDDPDYPALSMGRAAEVLGVQPAFLRSLDAAGILSPARSSGGHRRYSRRQLEHVQRIMSLADDGHTIAGAEAFLRLEAERDSALSARDDAVSERDTARAERDTARAELDDALAERDTARAERDTARAELDDRAHGERT